MTIDKVAAISRAKRTNTWMPLYVGDYLRDTGHLTACEHGGYMLLLMQAWTNEGALPTDEARLRTIAKMDQKQWRRSCNTLLAFFQRDGNVLRQKRLDRELAFTGALNRQRSGAGKASAEARNLKKKNNDNNDDTQRTLLPVEPPVATGASTKRQQKAGHTHTHTQKERITPTPQTAGEDPRPQVGVEGDDPFRTFWKLYPRKIEGPAACRKEWAKALTSAPADEIIRGLRRYPFKPDYLPMAATWLNQRRWLTQTNTPPPLVLTEPRDPTFSPGAL